MIPKTLCEEEISKNKAKTEIRIDLCLHTTREKTKTITKWKMCSFLWTYHVPFFDRSKQSLYYCVSFLNVQCFRNDYCAIFFSLHYDYIVKISIVISGYRYVFLYLVYGITEEYSLSSYNAMQCWNKEIYEKTKN